MIYANHNICLSFSVHTKEIIEKFGHQNNVIEATYYNPSILAIQEKPENLDYHQLHLD